LIVGRALLLSLGIVAGQPAPAPPGARPPVAPGDKMLAVRLEPFRFVAGAPPAGWADPSFDDRRGGHPRLRTRLRPPSSPARAAGTA